MYTDETGRIKENLKLQLCPLSVVLNGVTIRFDVLLCLIPILDFLLPLEIL